MEPSPDVEGPNGMTRSRSSTARQLVIAWSIALGVVVVPLLAVAGVRFLSAEGAHDRAVERWESKEPAAYSFNYSYCGGFCQGCTTRVTVKRGEVVSAVPAEPGGCTDFTVEDAPTIEDVFDLEKTLRSRDEFVSREIHYDSTWGFPASANFQCPEGTSDCGPGLSVRNFRVEP